MDKKERFIKAYKYLVSENIIRKQEDLAVAMEASRSNISSALGGNEKVLTERFLMRLCRAYPGLFSLTWLLTGEGEMLLKEEQEDEEPDTPVIDYSSLMNAIIASKDGEIASKDNEIAAKNDVIRSKDDMIMRLEKEILEKDRVIMDLRQTISILQYNQNSDERFKKGVFPIGLAEEGQTKKL